MLVLSRKARQRVMIGDDIVVEVVRIGPNNVRLGITAPTDVNVMREELVNDANQPPRLAEVRRSDVGTGSGESGGMAGRP